MNYGLRFWLLLIAFLLGWFHMARGQSDTIHIPSTKDVRRMIDSAFQLRDTAGQHDTLLPGVMSAEDYDKWIESVQLPIRPADCLKMDTVWCAVLWDGRIGDIEKEIHHIDSTWGDCDE